MTNLFLDFPLLRTHYQTMTRREKKIAEYIAAHRENIAGITIAELADSTGSSDVTVSRFCKKMGFSGIQELKVALAQDLATTKNIAYHAVHPDDTTMDIAAGVFQNLAEGLQDTLKLLDCEAVDSAVNLIMKARKIAVFGFGNSATVCTDIETRFLRFGFAIHAYADAHMQATVAALAKKSDAIIAVSHRGTSRDLLDAIEIAKNRGAKLIAITSYIRSPLAQLCDVVLSGMGREVQYFSEAMASRLIHMAIADVLYLRIAMQMPEPYEKNMELMRAALDGKRVSPRRHIT